MNIFLFSVVSSCVAFFHCLLYHYLYALYFIIIPSFFSAGFRFIFCCLLVLVITIAFWFSTRLLSRSSLPIFGPRFMFKSFSTEHVCLCAFHYYKCSQIIVFFCSEFDDFCHCYLRSIQEKWNEKKRNRKTHFDTIWKKWKWKPIEEKIMKKRYNNAKPYRARTIENVGQTKSDIEPKTSHLAHHASMRTYCDRMKTKEKFDSWVIRP